MLDVSRILILLVFVSTAFLGCKDEGTDTDTDADGETEVETVKDLNSIVCNAFDDESSVEEDERKGVKASLYYLEDHQTRYDHVGDYIANGSKVEGVDLYFNKIHVPTRRFSRGIMTQANELVKTSKGDAIYEWLALRLEGLMHVGPGDKHEKYQLAVLADDGAILSIDRGNGLEVVVNNDGQHSTRMACASEPVTFKPGEQLPFQLDYYQGARYHIALILMWRPWPAAEEDANDPLCNDSGDSLFFDSNQSPPRPKRSYRSLIARGWRILRPVNFSLPEQEENPCNEPAPVLSGLAVTNVHASAATVKWDTDIGATSQVVVVEAATGISMTTDEDSLLVKSHSVDVTGLKADTVYMVKAVSRSSSGLSAESSELYFRTGRLY